MDRVVQSYCLACDWVVRDDTVADRSAAVIEHTVATGHDIESVTIDHQPTTSQRTFPQATHDDRPH